jgi:hypothetical protein
MNHHDKNLDELAKKEGLNSEKVVDYSQVEQGVDSQPKMSEVQTYQPETPKSKGKKGKGKGKGQALAAASSSGAPKTIKDKIRCGGCNNLMLQSTKLNYETIPDRKIPKDVVTGKAMFKSPGVAQGSVGAVLCDDCKRLYDEGRMMITSAIVERPNGSVSNVGLGEIPTA